MRQRKTFIIVAILLALLLLSVGYAAISSTNLYITGTASAIADSKLNVVFDQAINPTTSTTSTSDDANVEAVITDTTHATIKVEGLAVKDDVATATYTIANKSEDVNATLTATTSNDNETYFSVDYEFANTTVNAQNSTTVTVKVKLLKTPVTDAEAEAAVANIGLTITANPNL